MYYIGYSYSMSPKYDSKSKRRMLRRKKCPSSSASDSSSSSSSASSSSESEDITLSEEETSSSESYVSPKKKDVKRKGKVIMSEDDDEDTDLLCASDDELSEDEIRRQIAKMFPSKYMSNRLKRTIQETDTDSDSPRPRKSKKSSHKKSKKGSNRRHKKRVVSKSESESESESEETEDTEETDTRKEYAYDDDEEEDDEDYEEGDDIGDDKKLNIFLTIGGGGMGEDDDDDAYNAEDDNEDEECESDVEKTFMKENYQEVAMPEEDSKDESKKTKRSKRDAKKDAKKKAAAKAAAVAEPTDIEKEYLELLDLKKHLSDKLHKNPKSKMMRNAIKECNLSIRKLIKDARIQNTKMYYEMTRTEKKKTNEIDYFKKKLSNKEQLKIMRDLKEINSHLNIEKPYRLSLLQSKIPAKFKAVAMHKLNMLRNMEPGDPEYHKVKNWVDTFMKIPFGTYKNLSINMSDGIDVCSEFLEKSKKTLDECVYGLDDAKLQIMQMLGQWIANPSSLGTAIAIKGAMGTGKTTLVKEGISKILGREFAFIALGGASDSSFLEGHSYTYEGSTWGKIVQILIESKCMNPVIYFDELDKISDTPKGQEIVGILTHLTDTSQNSQFHDKYFSEIDFDLSKCLFIFSYNDENLVNPILRDRMYRIQTKGYDSKEKTVITKNYLLPKIREQVRFNAEEIIIPDDTIQYIVSSNKFTKGEEGVRNLKRCLEIIYTKLNLFRLMKTNNPMLQKHMQMEVEFPFTVLRKHVDILIKGEDYQNQSFLSLYV